MTDSDNMMQHSPGLTSAPVLLEAEGLCFSYPHQTLFTDWSARIAAGVTSVRGGDGAGKSTLLRLLAGDLAPERGQLRANGIPRSASLTDYQRQVFWVDMRSAASDALLPGQCFEALARRYPGFQAQLLGDLLEGLSLTPHLGKRLDMLSTGSRRKVWLAGAFAAGAAVTLLDQPFAALDAPSIRFVTSQLQAAASDPGRAWVVADYEAPPGVALSHVFDLVG